MLKIDLNRAFDSVDWAGLKDMFKRLGIPSHMQKKFWSSYNNVKVRIQHSDAEDIGFILEHGVKQGGPESPIIFSLFIDPILRQLGECVAYADDVNLLTTQDNITAKLQHATKLFKIIGLSVSESKTEIWKDKTGTPLMILNMMVSATTEQRENLSKMQLQKFY